jgi:hypothetical protein
MMGNGRRVFMKRIGFTLAAFVSPRIATKPGGLPNATTIGDLEPFVEMGGMRISGGEALAAKGLKFNVNKGPYPRGERYNLSILNSTSTPQVVDIAGLSLAAPAGNSDRDWRVFLDVGSSGWCGVKRLAALKPDRRLEPVRPQKSPPFHRSDLQTVVWDAKSGEAFLVGFLRQHCGHNKIDVIPNKNASAIARFEAWQEFGFELPPGREQSLDPLVRAQAKDPYALLDQFGSAVKEYQGRSFDSPPIVGMMTWYGYRTAINEDLVLDNAMIVADLFAGYPQKMQKVMLCDHGWQEDANWGYWEPDKKRFPHGMRWLARELAKCGMELGLWYTPFCITENAPNYNELVPLQALGDDGRPRQSHSNVWGHLPGQPRTRSVTYFDGAKEAVQKMWADTMLRMKDWGVVYLKLDFFALQSNAAERSHLGVGDLYARTWKTFHAAVGGDVMLNPCSCPTNLQLGYDYSTRIASDIGNAGNWPGAMDSYRFGMGTIVSLWYKNRRFWINDPDSVQVAKGCALNEARVRATVAALSGGHLMVSEDLRDVDNGRLEMIRRLIPPYPQAARPLDMFENPFPEGYPVFWALSIPTGFGPMTTLAVFNLANQTQPYEITPKMLGIESGKEFLALEWWQCRWLGRYKDKFQIDVPAEDVAVIHAQRTRDVPSLLSVSHHITGGYIVEDVSFDPQTGTLGGVLATKAGLRVVLFGHLPAGWILARESTFHTMSSTVGGWQSEVVTTGTRTSFEIQFAKA